MATTRRRRACAAAEFNFYKRVDDAEKSQTETETETGDGQWDKTTDRLVGDTFEQWSSFVSAWL